MSTAAPTPSPLDDINAAILSHNPFAQPPFVNANNVWGKGFPDVETLNSHASDAVFRALEEIRSGHYSTTSILITAQDGTGKTHIISRIRHRLQDQGGALFVFANKFNDLNQIKPGFQQILAESLSNIGSQGVKQWQELATAMANDVFVSTNPKTQPIAAKNLVKKFESVDEGQVGKWIHQLTKKFCKLRTVEDPDIVRAIFWTLSDDEVFYASNWLAGKELAQFKSNELGLPSQKQSFDAVLQIFALISKYNELVICFDELDVLDFSDIGFHKSCIVANLVKELVENLKRGVILSVMMPGTWQTRVQKELPSGVRAKLTTFSDKPYELQYLNSDTAIDLVAFFLKNYYEARQLIPPHPIYPFEIDQLKAISRQKSTVREVLKWCRENCKPPEDNQVPPIDKQPTDSVELAFTNEMSEVLGSRIDDNSLIADALFLGFQGLIGQTIENVTIREVTTGVGKKGGKDSYLNFKITGEDEGKEVVIGVAVLQYDGGGALGAGFRRLLDEENRFSLTRGCLVRSKEKPINSYFQRTYLTPFIKKGGEFVELKENELQPLIAIHSVYQKRDSDYQVTEEQIAQFIANRGTEYFLGSNSPLIKEILSDPSYQVPEIEVEKEATEVAALVNGSDTQNDSEELGITTNDLEELMVHV